MVLSAPRGAFCAALAVVLLGLTARSTWAADPQAMRPLVGRTQRSVEFSLAPIVKLAAPAVVNVYASGHVMTQASPFADDPLFQRLFGRAAGQPVERVQNSLGSGVIVSTDGVVVTNTHVVNVGSQTEIKVALADSREFAAHVILQDEKNDITVLKIDAQNERLPFIEFDDSDGLEVGDQVLAIGDPFGVGQTVTHGIISALARSEVGRSDAQVFIQTDAAINPGNSGGALINMDGRLIGINTAIVSRSGGSQGIGFAIPSNLVRLFVDSAISGQKIVRPWLGAKLIPVTRAAAQSLNLEKVTGALVTRLYERGPAAEAGLKIGDVIMVVEGVPVADARAALYRLTTQGVGQIAHFDVLRAGQTLHLAVPLRQAPKPGRDDIRNLSGNHPFEGARVANLVPSIVEELGLEADEGVVILSVRPKSIAQRLRLEAGDIILSVGRHKIANLNELEQAIAEQPQSWQVAIRRGEQTLQLEIPG